MRDLPSLAIALGLALTGCGSDDSTSNHQHTGAGGSGGNGGSAAGGGTAGSATGGTSGTGTGGTSSGSCVVHWLDPLGYTKPACIDIPLPNEATVENRYFIDLSNGSGTSCTEASPCKSFDDVQGKPGTTGGPAFIHLKGQGPIGSPTLYGAAGNEVVILPWDDGSDATITGRNNWTTRQQYVVWDGGPDLRIRFRNSGQNQFDPSVYFDAEAGLHDTITFRRTEWQVTNAGEWVAQWGMFQNLSFLNNEFHATDASDTENQHHLYFSGASNFGGSGGLVIRGNVFRSTPGEAIEFRVFQTFSDIVIDGNAFHDIGKGTCSGSWGCRSAITFASTGGDYAGTLRVSNNLIWSTGENCVRSWDNPASTQFFANTCFDWGAGDSATGKYASAAFANYSFDADVPGDFRNNLLYATGNDANGNAKTAFPNGASLGSYNACAGGASCGSSTQAVSADAFLSLDPDSADFLKLAPNASPIDHGTALGELTHDYTGATRDGAPDIGAFETQ